MATFTLNINIDPTQVLYLKEQGFSLFLAKLVQDQAEANVIWRSTPSFLEANLYQWLAAYAIAGTESVEVSHLRLILMFPNEC